MTPAILPAVLLALAAVVTLGLLAGPAVAQPAYSSCASCHASGTTHAGGNANHTGVACLTCHNDTGGMGDPPLPSACGSCHGGVTAILAANTTHTSAPQSCGTTNNCHGYTAPPTQATTTLTAKAAPTTVSLGKKVKVSGLAGPVPALVGAKIAFKVERRVGTKWVKMKAPATATVATLGPYSWTYKAVKKGSHQVTLSIKATTTFTAKKLVKTFKVK